MKESTAQRDSFVVRITRGEEPSDWWGWVQHVGSGEEVCVRSLGELLAFIESRAALPKPGAPAARLK